MAASRMAEVRPQGMRRNWLADAVIAGFVATGASTVALVVGFLVAHSLGVESGPQLQVWLWDLTRNPLVARAQGAPAAAIGVHILFGIIWALLYAAFFEPRLNRPAWQEGMLFALIAWLASLLVFLPIAGAGFFGLNLGAGPMPAIGNLITHLVWGFTLGQLYNRQADQPDTAEGAESADDLALDHAVAVHAEGFAAGGIVAGAVVGGVIGLILAVVLPAGARATEGWPLVIAITGALAGAAVGAMVGAFAGLPDAKPDPIEQTYGQDPFERQWLVFLIPFVVLIAVIVLIVLIGNLLLVSQSASQDKLIPVWIAIGATFAIGIGGFYLSRSGPPASDHDTVSQRGH